MSEETGEGLWPYRVSQSAVAEAQRSVRLRPNRLETPRRVPAAIHLDLDGSVHIFRAHGWVYRASHDLLFETGLQYALDFFDKAGVRATLFVIAEDLNDTRKYELLKEAVSRGHEIASHSLTHGRLSSLDSNGKRFEIFESRDRIAQKLGVEVQGFRAPGFDIDRETFELVDEAGYMYDSSLFLNTRRAGTIGAKKTNESPHYPFEGRELVELPLPSCAPLPLPFHPSYSLVLGTWYFQLGLRAFQATHAPLVLLFHLTDLADPLPNSQLPNWKARLYTLSHISAEDKRQCVEEMLNLVRQEYTFVDTLELLAMHGNDQRKRLSPH